ncbi:MAG: hypothetical protein M3Q07_01835 [Pseudobdellovibrionaceae bacterium]|nr:hypothetical protein [Pseudobdellovibrionaceae bacterium]
MKVLSRIFLAAGLLIANCSFAADEDMVVTGSKDQPGPSPGFSGGGPGGGLGQALVQGKPCPPDGGVNCGGGSSGGKFQMPTKVGDVKQGDAVKDDLGTELGKIFAFLARDFDAAGEIWVKIETPSGYKIEVRITAQAKVTGKR